ncbi:MAG: hypothetical protein ACR2GH_07660 [Pseudonocardia sp.]
MNVCWNCAWENEVDAEHCAGCRAYIGGEGAQGDPAPAPSPLPPTPAPPVPASSAPPVPPLPPSTDSRPGRSAPEVPRRSIPVRVAPVVRAPPHPIVIAAPAQDAAPRPADLPAAGEMFCRSCRRPVPGDRHFCRCGSSVRPPPAEPSLGSPQLAPWWSELAARRRFGQALRAANGGSAAGYDVALSVRTQLVRLILVVLLVAAVGSQLGPWGSGLRREISERIGQLLSVRPAGVSQLHVVEVLHARGDVEVRADERPPAGEVL